MELVPIPVPQVKRFPVPPAICNGKLVGRTGGVSKAKAENETKRVMPPATKSSKTENGRKEFTENRIPDRKVSRNKGIHSKGGFPELTHFPGPPQEAFPDSPEVCPYLSAQDGNTPAMGQKVCFHILGGLPLKRS